MMVRALPLAAALLLPGAAAARAQTTEPADTTAAEAPADSAPPARPSRWATPFSVESTGRPTPRRVQGEVVWATPERASRATRLAEETPDSTAADTAVADTTPRRRTAARDTARPAPRRTARADTTAPRDTASTRASARRDTARVRTAASGTRPRTHRVAEGETLFGIARRYSVTTAQLRALNPNDTSGELEVGAVLRLPPAPRPAGSTPAPVATRPAADRPATSDRATAPSRPAASTRRRTHTVASGETLFGLARRYGVSTDAIRRANDLPSDQLRAGQTIVIPAQ